MKSLFMLPLVLLLATANVTITMQEDELAYCYFNGHEDGPSCSYTEIDKDRFTMINRFMEFLASGDLKK